MVGFPIGFRPQPSLVLDEMSNPIGSITLWSGSVASIPANWQLCDGTNGTPDLRDRFIQGAGGALNPGGIGGEAEHDHTFAGDGHVHANGGVLASSTAGPSFKWDGDFPSAAEVAMGTTDLGMNAPPFHALAYIQRMT